MSPIGVVVSILEIVVLLNGVESYYNVSESNDKLRKVFCAKQYGLNCLKIDLISTAERMGGTGVEYQLYPGFFLSHRFNATDVPPPESLLDTARSLIAGDGDSRTDNATLELDTYVTDKVNKYLSSVTLSVKLLDPNAMSQARRFSEQLVSSLFSLEKGRKKGGGWAAGGALWAAGSVAAVGMAALAALAGKALMTSMLAMMLAAAAALRGGGGGGKGGGGHDCGTSHAALLEAMHARHYDTERMASDSGFYRRSDSSIYSPREISSN